MHVMIEAKKLAYADMLRYVADPQFAKVPVAADAEQGARGKARAPDQSGEGRVHASSRRSSTA